MCTISKIDPTLVSFYITKIIICLSVFAMAYKYVVLVNALLQLNPSPLGQRRNKLTSPTVLCCI